MKYLLALLLTGCALNQNYRSGYRHGCYTMWNFLEKRAIKTATEHKTIAALFYGEYDLNEVCVPK